MEKQPHKRYPGSRPFEDTELDRMLFQGREQETQRMLHLVLAERLVVLFSKSGVGKSSLINAGLAQRLSKRHYFPITIRLNDPTAALMETVDDQVKQAAKNAGIDHTPGDKETLWHYFKTAEFWSAQDTLLTPVLVFDQFEEIFTLGYSQEQRDAFFEQLADLVRGSVPASAKQKNQEGQRPRYTETAPEVKIILSMREDFLANLEEISTEIPSILKNRFRLLALTPDQARKAIEEPAQLDHEALTSQRFSYDEKAIESILNFLLKEKDPTGKPDVSRRKIWRLDLLAYMALLIILLPFVSFFFDLEVELALDYNAILIIPMFSVRQAFARPIKPAYAILTTLGLHLLNVLTTLGLSLLGYLDRSVLDLSFDGLAIFLIVLALFALINIVPVALISWWKVRRSVKARTRVGALIKKEVEPFQLQLLCQHIEDKVLQQQKTAKANGQIVVKEEDFGGEEGMQQILQAFYDTQIKRIKPKNRRATRNLCEKGLISATGRRLSLDEEIIAEKYKVSPEILLALIDYRLLRAVPRLGSYYYEISHDTLVKPILNAVKQRQGRRRNSILLVGGILLLYFIGFGVSTPAGDLMPEEVAYQTRDLDFLNAEVSDLNATTEALIVNDTLTVYEKEEALQFVDYSQREIAERTDAIYSISINDSLKAMSRAPQAYDSLALSTVQLRNRVSELEGKYRKFTARIDSSATIRSTDNFFTFKRFVNREPRDVTGEFRVTDPIWICAIIYAPQDEVTTLKWYDSEGNVTYEQSISVRTSSSYRIWRRARNVQVGKHEVRLYNEQGDLIGRQVFYVSD